MQHIHHAQYMHNSQLYMDYGYSVPLSLGYYPPPMPPELAETPTGTVPPGGHTLQPQRSEQMNELRALEAQLLQVEQELQSLETNSPSAPKGPRRKKRPQKSWSPTRRSPRHSPHLTGVFSHLPHPPISPHHPYQPNLLHYRPYPSELSESERELLGASLQNFQPALPDQYRKIHGIEQDASSSEFKNVSAPTYDAEGRRGEKERGNEEEGDAADDQDDADAAADDGDIEQQELIFARTSEDKRTQMVCSYVPYRVSSFFHHTRAGRPLVTPCVEYMDVALLFLDMSGFTPLTEKLSMKGMKGVEEVSHHLNDYFGQIIARIHDHGGDVIKFAGDALLVMWADYIPAPNKDQKNTQRRNAGARANNSGSDRSWQFDFSNQQLGSLHTARSLAQMSLKASAMKMTYRDPQGNLHTISPAALRQAPSLTPRMPKAPLLPELDVEAIKKARKKSDTPRTYRSKYVFGADKTRYDQMMDQPEAPEDAVDQDDGAEAPQTNPAPGVPETPSEHRHLHDFVLRAVQCTIDIYKDFHGYEPVPGITLKLHSGISAGRVSGIHVGGFEDRWEYLLKGDPLAQLKVPTTLAQNGEFVLSGPAFEYASPSLEGVPLEQGCFRFTAIVPGQEVPVVPLPTLKLPKQKPDADKKLRRPPPRVRSNTTMPNDSLDLVNLLPEDEFNDKCRYKDIDFDFDLSASLRSYTPTCIHPRLDAGHSVAELRKVTVLFILLPEQDFDTTDVSARRESLRQLQAIVSIIQESVHHYAGNIRQLITDDKGTVMIAVFGLTSRSKTSVGMRGVRAALKLQHRLRIEENVHLAIGITTGNVFCGSIGSELRCEYTVVGDAVNTSARLMSKVPNHDGIFCDESTQSMVDAGENEDIQFAKLRPLALKGKKQPVPVYSPSYYLSRPPNSRVYLLFKEGMRLNNNPIKEADMEEPGLDRIDELVEACDGSDLLYSEYLQFSINRMGSNMSHNSRAGASSLMRLQSSMLRQQSSQPKERESSSVGKASRYAPPKLSRQTTSKAASGNRLSRATSSRSQYNNTMGKPPSFATGTEIEYNHLPPTAPALFAPVVLLAPLGGGRLQFLAKLQHHAHSSGLGVLAGHCSEHEGMTAYYGFRGVVFDVLLMISDLLFQLNEPNSHEKTCPKCDRELTRGSDVYGDPSVSQRGSLVNASMRPSFAFPGGMQNRTQSILMGRASTVRTIPMVTEEDERPSDSRPSYPRNSHSQTFRPRFSSVMEGVVNFIPIPKDNTLRLFYPLFCFRHPFSGRPKSFQRDAILYMQEQLIMYSPTVVQTHLYLLNDVCSSLSFVLPKKKDIVKGHARALATQKLILDLLRMWMYLRFQLNEKRKDTKNKEAEISSPRSVRTLRTSILRQAEKPRPGAPNLHECGFILTILDYQWLDPMSKKLLKMIRKNMPSLGLVLTALPTSEHSANKELLSEPEAVVISFSNLTLEQTTVRLLHACRKIDPSITAVSHVLAQKIWSWSDRGRPAFVENTLSYMKNRFKELVKVEDGQVDLSNPDIKFELSEAMEEVIGGRIDSLPPTQQLIVKVCSVVGTEINFDIVKDIFPVRSPDVLANLSDEFQQLCDAGIFSNLNAGADEVIPVAPMPSDSIARGARSLQSVSLNEFVGVGSSVLEPLSDDEEENTESMSFLFEQELVRDVIYKRLLFSYRANLHRLIAQWYEKKYREDLDPYCDLLARQWEQVYNQETDPTRKNEAVHKCVSYSIFLGKKLLSQGARSEAAATFKRAMGMIDASEGWSPKEELDLIAKFMQVAVRLISPEVMLAKHERMLQLCEVVPNTDAKVWIQAIVGKWKVGHLFPDSPDKRRLVQEATKQLHDFVFKINNNAWTLEYYYIATIGELLRGQYSRALENCKIIASIYDPREHKPNSILTGRDVGLFGKSISSLLNVVMGNLFKCFVDAKNAIALAGTAVEAQALNVIFPGGESTGGLKNSLQLHPSQQQHEQGAPGALLLGSPCARASEGFVRPGLGRQHTGFMPPVLDRQGTNLSRMASENAMPVFSRQGTFFPSFPRHGTNMSSSNFDSDDSKAWKAIEVTIHDVRTNYRLYLNIFASFVFLRNINGIDVLPAQMDVFPRMSFFHAVKRVLSDKEVARRGLQLLTIRSVSKKDLHALRKEIIKAAETGTGGVDLDLVRLIVFHILEFSGQYWLGLYYTEELLGQVDASGDDSFLLSEWYRFQSVFLLLEVLTLTQKFARVSEKAANTTTTEEPPPAASTRPNPAMGAAAGRRMSKKPSTSRQRMNSAFMAIKFQSRFSNKGFLAPRRRLRQKGGPTNQDDGSGNRSDLSVENDDANTAAVGGIRKSLIGLRKESPHPLNSRTSIMGDQSALYGNGGGEPKTSSIRISSRQRFTRAKAAIGMQHQLAMIAVHAHKKRQEKARRKWSIMVAKCSYLSSAVKKFNEALTACEKSIDIARKQHAKGLELRSLVSMCKLMLVIDKTPVARLSRPVTSRATRVYFDDLRQLVQSLEDELEHGKASQAAKELDGDENIDLILSQLQGTPLINEARHVLKQYDTIVT